MILVLGGTSEGREIASALAKRGYSVLVTVVSEYGAEVNSVDSRIEVLVERFDAQGLERLITDRNITWIIDATHPYARVITETAWLVAQKTGIPYNRFERETTSIDSSGPRVYRAVDYEEAAKKAIELGQTIFLTIGSNNLGPFIRAGKKTGRRVVARMLPDAGALEQCASAGIVAKDIIAIQGPFSEEMNLAMFNEYRTEVLVTKDSGSTGGTDSKLAAAARLGIPVVVIERPKHEGMPVITTIDEIMEQAARYKD